ncbi:MAG: DUF6675 family protein [Methyloceanibacter sp.]
MRTLLAIAVLLCSAGLCAAERGPLPPCAGVEPVPAYAAPGAPPNSHVWKSAELGGWTPPACAGFTAKGDGVLVAVAGSFPFTGSADALLARFGAVSALKGLKYWSVTEGGWRTLITKASALEGPDASRPRSDFTLAEMRSGVGLYFAQSENRAAGDVVYRMRVRDFGPERFVVAIDNVSPVSRYLVTLFNPGDLTSIHFLERRSPGVWGYYGLAWAGDGLVSRLAVPEASYLNRAMALYRHFLGENRP